MQASRRWLLKRVGFGVLTCGAVLSLAMSRTVSTPGVDYHQHLLSPAAARQGGLPHPVTARDLIPLLDAAGVRRAVILSLAYQFGNPNRPAVEDEYAHVKAENDWTAQQTALFPDRLQAFCGVNPLKEYALAEIARCAGNPRLRSGLKIHCGNSDVDLDQPEQVTQMRRVFRAANDAGMAIAIHLHPSISRHRPYGAKEARVFLNEVLPAAPAVPVQIAHLAGAGGYDDPATDKALSVFIDAINMHDARMAHVYFDISGVAGLGEWKSKKDQIAERIRQAGVGRILWGSDGAFGGGMTPQQALTAYRELPLSATEFEAIDKNVAPYMENGRE